MKVPASGLLFKTIMVKLWKDLSITKDFIMRKPKERVTLVCPSCGKERTVIKKDHAVLCHSCAARKQMHSICHLKRGPRPIVNIIGNTYGLLKVESYSHKNDIFQHHWKCICKCGQESVVPEWRLKCGHTKSCGCMNKTQKGLSQSRMCCLWRTMKARCYNPKQSSYKFYGAKGIRVCTEWIESFSNFVSDMGECPKGLTLDRIDYNGDYSKENCRWVDYKVQGNNRSDNRFIEAFGQRLTLSQWAFKTGIIRETIYARLKNNWSIEKALTTKTLFRKKHGIK